MLKLGKIITALALGLVMSLSLAATGVFAQSANPQTTSNGAQAAVTTTALPSASTAVQHASVQQLSWAYRGPGGFYGHRGYGYRGFYGGRGYGYRSFYGGRGYGYRGFYGGRGR
jgi:hypothetical protein